MTWPRSRVVPMPYGGLVRVRTVTGPIGEPVLELTEIVREGGNVARVLEAARVHVSLADLDNLIAAMTDLRAEALADPRLSERRRSKMAARQAAQTAAEF